MTDLKKIRPLWEACVSGLKQAGVSCPEKTATALILYVLDMEKEAPPAFVDLEIDESQLNKIEQLIKRRKKGEPLPQIMGHIIFHGLKIYARTGVSNPVFESESFIDQILLFLENKKEQPLRILDLGTGTGCILLALLRALPQATGVGIDISERAVALARINAEENGLSDRAAFCSNDWNDGVSERFDLVIGNPPAAPTKSIPHLSPELSQHDPIAAVDGGKDGLSFFKEIVQNFENLAKPDATGIFHVHHPKRESSVFRKAGFPVETKFNSHYKQSDVYLEPCCIVVINRKLNWVQRIRQFFSKFMYI